MADYITAGRDTDKCFIHTGFTTTISNSIDYTSAGPSDSLLRGHAWDLTDTLVSGDSNNKIYKVSGQFTTTVKDSFGVGGAIRGISHDATNVLAIFEQTTSNLITYSGIISSTAKSTIAVADNNPTGVSTDGIDTFVADISTDKLYKLSGVAATDTVKVSIDHTAVDTIPFGIGWDGTDVPWAGSQANKYYKQSGVLTSTLKTSISSESGEGSPHSIDTIDTNTRLGISSSVTGTLVGDIGQLTGTITGSFGPSGTLVGDIGQLTGSITGYMVPAGTLVGDIGQLTGSISGAFGPSGTLTGDIGQLSGSISGTVKGYVGTLTGTIVQLTGSISGSFGPSGTLVGDIGQLTGSISGTVVSAAATGTLVGDIGQLTGSITGAFGPSGTLTGDIGQLTGDISGLSAQPVTGTLVGDIGQLTGSISGEVASPSLGGGVSFTELRKGQERERELERQREFNKKAREQREKEARQRKGKKKAKKADREEETPITIQPLPVYEADLLKKIRPPMVFGLFPPEEMSDFMRRAMGYSDSLDALMEADLIRQAEFDADDELAVEMLLMSM